MKRRHQLHPRTAVINKAQQTESRKIRNQALEWLAVKFPEAFDNTKRIRPLKIGIMNDILQLNAEAVAVGISRSKLREAVVLFTRRLDYLTCLKAQEMRVDLNGNTISPVSTEESENAATQIKKHLEKKARNAQQDETQQKITNSWFSTYEPNTNNKNQSDCINPPIANNATKPNILIKHKITRAYDPIAVARLKNKLGLSQPKPIFEETK